MIETLALAGALIFAAGLLVGWWIGITSGPLSGTRSRE